ncbi:MAG: glycosyltransferase family 117 protein [bacterium]
MTDTRVLIAAVCCLILFVIYLSTRTPAVGLIDSGEIAAGCYLLNILHPTGYPLYTIIGRLFSLLPLGTVVNRLTFLSAVFSLGAIGVFIRICRQMKYNILTSGAIAILLGLSPPVWSVSTDVEVYSLTLFLSALVWLVLLNSARVNAVLLFAYLSGLTLTNHMTGLWTVIGAGLTLLLIGRKGLLRASLLALPLFFLGLTPYLFLILRARAGPLLSWGNPINLERFWWHIAGRQYQVWMFSSSLSGVITNAGKGVLLLLRTFGFILLPVVIYGFLSLFRRQKELALGLAVSALLCLFYAVNYQIPDIQAYYGPAVLVLSIFAATGIDRLHQRLGKIIYSVWVVPIAVFFLNYPIENKSQDWVGYDQALNTLKSADTNAIIITDWWDIYAPVFYLQEVEKIRPDVCIIDKELLRRSWYFKYLEKKYPDLIENSRTEVSRFSLHLLRFEYNKPYDPVAIQQSYIHLLRSFFINNPRRPVYVTFPYDASDDSRQMLNGFNLVPMGILFQVRSDTIVPQFDYHRFTVRIPRFGLTERTRFNLDRYQIFIRSRIGLLKRLNRIDEAGALEDWYQRQFKPSRP